MYFIVEIQRECHTSLLKTIEGLEVKIDKILEFRIYKTRRLLHIYLFYKLTFLESTFHILMINS